MSIRCAIGWHAYRKHYHLNNDVMMMVCERCLKEKIDPLSIEWMPKSESLGDSPALQLDVHIVRGKDKITRYTATESFLREFTSVDCDYGVEPEKPWPRSAPRDE